MIFELNCTETEHWSITDDVGSCPDCSALVATASIAAHVRWHEVLLCQLLAVCANQDELTAQAVELNPTNAGECVRLIHELQLSGLRESGR
jgi:hypothetical protein